MRAICWASARAFLGALFFNYKKDLKETVFSDSKGFVNTTVAEAEKQTVTGIMQILGVAMLLAVFMDSFFSRLLILILDAIGLKNWKFEIAGYVGYERCVITAGGVSLDEITPKTLESKLVPGLYFAGEVLDLDADTGGYNLQTAFSTGYLAGINAARFLDKLEMTACGSSK